MPLKGEIFNHSGFASLEDIESREWQELFNHLEGIQEEFLSHEPEFRSPEYIWPRDPLHNWSRVWEYPYVLYHLRKWRKSFGPGQNPRLVDFGSGVTFFPFAAAREGFEVMAIDVDPVSEKDFKRASRIVPSHPGTTEFRLASAKSIPLPDHSVPAAYCISVLEHVSDLEGTIQELARVLEPKGLLILTVDISLNSANQFTAQNYRVFRTVLEQYFNLQAPERTTHPCLYLLNTGSLQPIFEKKSYRDIIKLCKNIFREIVLRQKVEPWYLTCQGFVLARK